MKRKRSDPSLQATEACRRCNPPIQPPVSKVDMHVHLALLQYLDCASVPAATRFLRALVDLPALDVASVRCSLCKTDVALWGWQETDEPSVLRCPGCGPRLAHTTTATSLLTDANPTSRSPWTPTSGLQAVRMASPTVIDEAARFLEATAPAMPAASPSAPSSTLLASLSSSPFAPVQHPRVCAPVYGFGAHKAPSIDAMAVLDGVADDARRAELKRLYRVKHVAMLQVDELVPSHPLRRWAEVHTRRQQGGVYDSAASVNSVEGRSLIIMAYASDHIVSGALLHADPAQADNTAFLLTGEDARKGTWKLYDTLCDPEGSQQPVVALWTFLNPLHIDRTALELQRMLLKRRRGRLPKPPPPQRLLPPPGLTTLPPIRLDPAQSHELAARLGPEAVRLVVQHAGQRVEVPAGWVHCVFNVRPCVKVAWDRLESSNLVRYVSAQQRIGAMYTCGTNPEDYIAVGALLLQHASLYSWRHGVEVGGGATHVVRRRVTRRAALTHS